MSGTACKKESVCPSGMLKDFLGDGEGIACGVLISSNKEVPAHPDQKKAIEDLLLWTLEI